MKMTENSKQPADYIVPLNMNGLKGRMLRLPPPKNKKREILFIYGHHSSLERWWGLVKELNRYGGVTMPDLPGFGGMDSFYQIGQAPTIDELADYLAAFIKLRYKRRRLTIMGLSLGFVVATRMLQRYPELTKKVDLLISVAGFAHRDDFTFSRSRSLAYRMGTRICTHRLPAFFFKNLALNPLVIRTIYRRTHNAKSKFSNVDKEEQTRLIEFEINLWHCNDVRTYMLTASEFLRLNNCTKQVDLAVWHLSISADQYFDNNMIEQHFRVIFNEFHAIKVKMDTHAPSVIADQKEAAAMIPPALRRLLSKA